MTLESHVTCQHTDSNYTIRDQQVQSTACHMYEIHVCHGRRDILSRYWLNMNVEVTQNNKPLVLQNDTRDCSGKYCLAVNLKNSNFVPVTQLQQHTIKIGTAR